MVSFKWQEQYLCSYANGSVYLGMTELSKMNGEEI